MTSEEPKKRPARRRATTTVMDAVEPGYTARARRGRINRERGALHERATAAALRTLWPNARRGLGQAREGAGAPDVVGTPLWIECGDIQRKSIESKFAQGLRDSAACPDSNYRDRPVVVVSRVDGRLLVTMELTLFEAMAMDVPDDRWDAAARVLLEQRKGKR